MQPSVIERSLMSRNRSDAVLQGNLKFNWSPGRCCERVYSPAEFEVGRATQLDRTWHLLVLKPNVASVDANGLAGLIEWIDRLYCSRE